MNSSTATAIVTALSAGAYFVALGVADEEVKHSYSQLKEHLFIDGTHLTENMLTLEREPFSPASAMAVRAELQNFGDDSELIHQARTLLDRLYQGVAVARGSIGVNKETIQQAKNVLSEVAHATNDSTIKSMKGDMAFHPTVHSTSRNRV